MPPSNNQPTQQPATNNPLAVMQPGEKVLFELKRHPIGIITIYIMTGFVLVALGVITFGVAPDLISSAGSQAISVGGLLYFFFALLCLMFNLIATIVYWGNRWVLTDDSITQITQTSLFHKESSSLALESLEDVTVDQHGIFPHIFNYGMLKAETAGQRSNFHFSYTPNPNYYAKKILEAHESENAKRNHQPAYYPQSQPQNFQQPNPYPPQYQPQPPAQGQDQNQPPANYPPYPPGQA
jgi:hypothetical protein